MAITNVCLGFSFRKSHPLKSIQINNNHPISAFNKSHHPYSRHSPIKPHTYYKTVRFDPLSLHKNITKTTPLSVSHSKRLKMGDVEETAKAISELTMASSPSSSQAPSKKALKRELKMKHKEEEMRLKEEKRGPKEKEMRPKEEEKKKNKGFHKEGKVMMMKGPFEVCYGEADMGGGVLVPYDQARVMLFKEYKEKADSMYGHPVTRVVLIIPPYSHDARLHRMIRDAATIAGLDLQRIIVKGPNNDEYPYGLPLRHGDPIAEIDFSGREYGMTVNQFHDIPNLCFQGRRATYENVLEHTVEYMKMAHGVDFTEDPAALQSLHKALMKGAATKSKVIITLPPATDGHGDERIERTVTLRELPWL